MRVALKPGNIVGKGGLKGGNGTNPSSAIGTAGALHG